MVCGCGYMSIININIGLFAPGACVYVPHFAKNLVKFRITKNNTPWRGVEPRSRAVKWNDRRVY